MLRLFLWTALGFGLLASPVRAVAADPPTYVVSILPLRGLVGELAGPGIEVECLVGPGKSPETFEPTSRQLTGLARARAVFLAGMPFEQALFARVDRQFPDLRRVDLSAGIQRRELPAVAGGEHGHQHGETDPHLWTGPAELRAMAQHVARALRDLQPGDAAAIDTRLRLLDARLESLDHELGAQLRPYAGRAVLAYHPAFGYFAAHYGLRQLAVESGGTEPGARHIVELAGRLRAEGVRHMICPPQFSPDRARTLARSLDVEVVTIDPLREDVEAMLREFAAILVASFSGERVVREGTR